MCGVRGCTFYASCAARRGRHGQLGWGYVRLGYLPTLNFRAFYAARLASLNIVGQGSTLLGLFRESSLDSKYEGKVTSALLIELE